MKCHLGVGKNGIDPSSERRLICDYTQSPAQIYTDLVHVHADKHNSLNILSFNDQPKDLTLPSWVSDWTSVWKACRFVLAPIDYIHPVFTEMTSELPLRYICNASADLKWDFTFVGNDKLQVTGINFDTLESLSEPFLDCHPSGETSYQTLLTWCSLALGESSEHVAEAYIAGGT